MAFQKKQDIRAVVNIDEFNTYFSDFHSNQDGKKYRKVTVKCFGLSISLIAFNKEPDIVLELKARKAMKKCLVALISEISGRIKENTNESGSCMSSSEG